MTNFTSVTPETNANIDTAFVDIKNKGIINKRTAVSVCGKDVVCMPRQAASTAGCGLAIGAGAALTYMGCTMIGVGFKKASEIVGNKRRGLKKFMRRGNAGGNAGVTTENGGDQ